MLYDRFTRGFIAGVLAGATMDILDIIGYILLSENVRYLDFAAIIAFSKIATSWIEVTVALLIELAFKGLLGVAFAYLITALTSKNLMLKAILYSVSIWFLIYGAIVIFNVNIFPKSNLTVAISHIINSSVYGLVLALLLKRFSKNGKNQ